MVKGQLINCCSWFRRVVVNGSGYDEITKAKTLVGISHYLKGTPEMQINPFYAVDKPHGKDREDEAEFPAEDFDKFFSRYSFSEGKWMIRKNEVPALVTVIEDHLDELVFGTFKPGCGARTEDGAVEVKGKMVTGQMGRNDPMMKLTVYVTVDGIGMALDVYMTFENGSWVIDAYQADVDHDEVKVID